ncbi:DUF2784 domain-containing protein [Kribbella sp. CA-293567]|uniref:DUF2784 domain-containing protein n=1 Tax=Kribbella sp. CA-293567 TaxID=3002436 RepID=UPI0022DD2858|nr:DUF2784 domain-containing protein [Kribbella sp. CA-293567]WBQ05514.1 DUF2784 domain-containing protein [Kribbella sp. CA-293567]
MIYRALADLVMIAHGAFLIFFVIGGFLAWKWRRVIWAHLFVAVWNLTIVILDFGCPVTALEKHWRREGGEQVYEGGFIQHYVDGTVYPEGYTWLAERIGFALLVISYLGLYFVSRRTRGRSVETRT